jgi:hypothetical protein
MTTKATTGWHSPASDPLGDLMRLRAMERPPIGLPEPRQAPLLVSCGNYERLAEIARRRGFASVEALVEAEFGEGFLGVVPYLDDFMAAFEGPDPS